MMESTIMAYIGFRVWGLRVLGLRVTGFNGLRT